MTEQEQWAEDHRAELAEYNRLEAEAREWDRRIDRMSNVQAAQMITPEIRAGFRANSDRRHELRGILTCWGRYPHLNPDRKEQQA